jgi:tetratricopeptide (TPR) repeat protein
LKAWLRLHTFFVFRRSFNPVRFFFVELILLCSLLFRNARRALKACLVGWLVGWLAGGFRLHHTALQFIRLKPKMSIKRTRDFEPAEKVNSLQAAKQKRALKRAIEHDMGEANLAFALGNLDEAMSLVHHVMESAPFHGPAFRLAALIFNERGQKENAIDALRLAVDADGQDVAAHKQLGVLLRETGELQQAARSFDRTIARDPSDLASLIGKFLRCMLSRASHHCCFVQSAKLPPPPSPP